MTVDTAAYREKIRPSYGDDTDVFVNVRDLAALLDCYEAAQGTREPLALGEPDSIQRDPSSNNLLLGWWRVGDPKAGEPHVVDIAKATITPEHLPGFMQTLSREAWTAVDDIATDYAYGDCEVCGNCRTVDVVKNKRDWNVTCPACGPRRGAAPFSNRPRIHRGTWDPTTPYDADTMKG